MDKIVRKAALAASSDPLSESRLQNIDDLIFFLEGRGLTVELSPYLFGCLWVQRPDDGDQRDLCPDRQRSGKLPGPKHCLDKSGRCTPLFRRDIRLFRRCTRLLRWAFRLLRGSFRLFREYFRLLRGSFRGGGASDRGIF